MEEILIVEDDADIAHLISLALSADSLAAHIAPNAESALSALGKKNFAACVLDIMLPGMDGLSFLKTLRSMKALERLPIIIASAKDDDSDIVAGLELGADDYLPKPFSPRVLAARVRALLRRASRLDTMESREALENHFESGGIVLDRLRHSVVALGEPVALSATEFSILELLMRSPGRVYTREQIIDQVKGPDYPVTDRAIDVHILSIRRKLGRSGERVETVRGIGYRFKEGQ
ncbi:MAG: two-component system OmpR family phosphate regulon response regulator PhoB [Spirochaetes bacterium]|nr:MAG: two-component system OmpR family phosphate regulon response regulator PhoB [Spirochaetota bacterium]